MFLLLYIRKVSILLLIYYRFLDESNSLATFVGLDPCIRIKSHSCFISSSVQWSYSFYSASLRSTISLNMPWSQFGFLMIRDILFWIYSLLRDFIRKEIISGFQPWTCILSKSSSFSSCVNCPCSESVHCRTFWGFVFLLQIGLLY